MIMKFEVCKKANDSLSSKKLKTISVLENVQKKVKGRVEAAAANSNVVVESDGRNSFVDAVHESYARHYPLTLSPDDIWLTIAQGFALHINADPEKYRKQFVQHEGKIELINFNDYKKGSPDNDWTKSFSFFSSEIKKHIGKKHNLIASDFSTTGKIELAASEVTLMDVMKSYFDYREMTLCGIPELTLLGTVEDWKKIKNKAQALSEYDLSWWTDDLIPVLDNFILAASGNPDIKFFNEFYKINGGSGGPTISGWINRLFPYNKKNKRNKGLNYWKKEVWHEMHTSDYPSGLASAPFIWNYYGQKYNMDYLAGFVGVYQDEETLSVRPSIGWAVQEVQ